MDKKKVEFLIAIIVILGLLIALVILFWNPKTEERSDTPGEIVTPAETERVSTVDSRTLESPPEVIARSFVERFGSYSTDIDYLNVDDVKSLATAALSTQLDILLTDARNDPDTGYYGVSTKVLTIDSVTQTETTASFDITTQRIESFDTPANTSSRNQDIEVTLIKNGNRWLVDGYTWIE